MVPGSAADDTMPVWEPTDSPSNATRRVQGGTPGGGTGSGRRGMNIGKCFGLGIGGGGAGVTGGGNAADSPEDHEDNRSVTPIWGGRHGASPAISAIAAMSPGFSPYHVESPGLDQTDLSPRSTHGGSNAGGRDGRSSGSYTAESQDELMAISSAARDLRELSQLSVATDDRGAGGGRVPSSGRVRSGGTKAGGRSRGAS